LTGGAPGDQATSTVTHIDEDTFGFAALLIYIFLKILLQVIKINAPVLPLLS
jgi:hypothetical protein